MNCPDLNQEIFISQFPEFKDSEYIELMIDRATNYVELYCIDCKNKVQFIIFLLAAHLLTIQKGIMSGNTSGLIEANAHIDRISVSAMPAPTSSTFDYWLSSTPYGMQLLAFFNLKFATPQYHGGSFVRVL